MERVQRNGMIGWRHEQIFLMFLGISIAYALRVNFSVGIVAMTSNTTNTDYPTIDWNTKEKGQLLGSFFFGYFCTQIPAGVIADRYGPSKFLAVAMLFCGVATLLFPLVTLRGGYYAAYASRVLQGLGQGFLYPCVNTHMSKWAVPTERGKLFAFAFGGSQFGTIVMLGIGGYLAVGSGGWPSIYYYSGAAAVIWGILCLLFVADSPRQHNWISEEERDYIEKTFGSDSPKTKERTSPPWGDIITSRPLWALLVVHMAQNWGFWTLLTMIPSYIKGVLNFNIQENGMLSSLPYIAMWLCTLIFSALADMVNRRKWLSLNFSRKMWNSIAHYGGACALMLLFFKQTNSTEAIILLTIAVALNAGTYLGYLCNHLDLSPNFAGVLMGITNGLANIASILGPTVAGYIVTDETNNKEWQTVFVTSAIIFFCGNSIFVLFGSTETQPWNQPKKFDGKEI
ncbi:putative inorganic phosphate cotransporter isoform X2 [Cimex lectularius]|uniref:Putative inorganic phosphate cotransporter n=1 Tax=Cimex lectularius TaxID=79782 RepID=A0A8I6RK56_CIMLE|nr:putative inorganic phosphate cotransporter isoform X2 [Cimex lectularius]